MFSAVRFLPLLGLLLLGCASLDTPYDAPRVGEDGIEAVFALDRYRDAGDGVQEIVVYHVLRDDGLECDVVFAKMEAWPDRWLALQHQRASAVGVFATGIHFTIPICLRVEAIP